MGLLRLRVWRLRHAFLLCNQLNKIFTFERGEMNDWS